MGCLGVQGCREEVFRGTGVQRWDTQGYKGTEIGCLEVQGCRDGCSGVQRHRDGVFRVTRMQRWGVQRHRDRVLKGIGLQR